MNICVFGDSTAWGLFDPDKGGWVTMLRNHFEQSIKNNPKNKNYHRVYNLSVCGSLTTDLLDRLESEATQRNPGLIILAVGLNDSRYLNSPNNQSTPIKIFHSNIDTLIQKAKSFTPLVIIMGITPTNDSLTNPIPWDKQQFYTLARAKEYNDALKKLATTYGLPFINVFNELTNNDLFDGLHPNTQGHEKIFSLIRSFLTENPLLM